MTLITQDSRELSLPDELDTPPLRIAALFAGIAGIEVGLHSSQHETAVWCEADPGAIAVLRAQFDVDDVLYEDVSDMPALPADVELVTAGFPCQDLSQAGRTAGIEGLRSGLVGHVFRLLEARRDDPPRWLLLENVPFMLSLDAGTAMRRLADALEELGYSWAYPSSIHVRSGCRSIVAGFYCWPRRPKIRAAFYWRKTPGPRTPRNRTGVLAASTGPKGCAAWASQSTVCRR